MNANITVGKREFIQHTSKYLRLAESGGDLIITHHNKPALHLVPFKEKSIKDLKGLITHIEVEGEINEHILSGFDEW